MVSASFWWSRGFGLDFFDFEPPGVCLLPPGLLNERTNTQTVFKGGYVKKRNLTSCTWVFILLELLGLLIKIKCNLYISLGGG